MDQRSDPLALSEEVTRPSLKKALDLIDHFPQKVKLHFDDIFVSTVKGVVFYPQHANAQTFGEIVHL